MSIYFSRGYTNHSHKIGEAKLTSHEANDLIATGTSQDAKRAGRLAVVILSLSDQINTVEPLGSSGSCLVHWDSNCTKLVKSWLVVVAKVS